MNYNILINGMNKIPTKIVNCKGNLPHIGECFNYLDFTLRVEDIKYYTKQRLFGDKYKISRVEVLVDWVDED
jgi:hypothetical protein